MNKVDISLPQPVHSVTVGLQCRACSDTAVVHWRRRLTDEEFAAHTALERSRREAVVQLSDLREPVLPFGPLPMPADCSITVFACADHAIALDAAALIHQAACTAPSIRDLPGCNCTPEPASAPDAAGPNARPLPPGWS